VWKRKPSVVALAPALRKTFRKRGRGRKSFHSGTQTSAQELPLAKPVKRSNKSVAKSSRLSVAKMAIAVIIKIAGKKMCSTSAGRSGVTQASTHALDLFGSGSSVSHDETTPGSHLVNVLGIFPCLRVFQNLP
jgi:hypothetical protein